MLLRCLSNRGPGTKDREPATTDWNEVVALAVYHGLAPLLFKRLKESDARACVATDAWERLRQAYFAGASMNSRLYRELGPVLRCLCSSAIPVVALKGAYLAEAVYGDVALRPMCDVDLMVPRAELPRAQAILLDLGGVYHQSENHESFDWTGHHHMRPVVVRDLTLEIHWTIVPPTWPVRIDAAGLWDRARPVTIAGVEVLALSPEDLLLHLCLSFIDSGLTGLKLLCDIAETIHRFGGEIDWAQVAHLAREWRAARHVGLTLHLARSTVGAAVPADALEQLVPGGLDQRTLETARECVIAQTDCLRSGTLIDNWDAMSLGGKAKLSCERVFLSHEEMAVMYPASRKAKHLWPYYVLRLRDATRTLVAHVLRRGLPTARSGMQDRNAALANWLRSRRP